MMSACDQTTSRHSGSKRELTAATSKDAALAQQISKQRRLGSTAGAPVASDWARAGSAAPRHAATQPASRAKTPLSRPKTPLSTRGSAETRPGFSATRARTPTQNRINGAARLAAGAAATRSKTPTVGRFNTPGRLHAPPAAGSGSGPARNKSTQRTRPDSAARARPQQSGAQSQTPATRPTRYFTANAPSVAATLVRNAAVKPTMGGTVVRVDKHPPVAIGNIDIDHNTVSRNSSRAGAADEFCSTGQSFLDNDDSDDGAAVDIDNINIDITYSPSDEENSPPPKNTGTSQGAETEGVRKSASGRRSKGCSRGSSLFSKSSTEFQDSTRSASEILDEEEDIFYNKSSLGKAEEVSVLPSDSRLDMSFFYRMDQMSPPRPR